MKMISVKKAEQILLKTAKPAGAVRTVLSACGGKILAEYVYADRDQPSADRSAMDGIAFAFDSWEKGSACFCIKGIQKAGAARKVLSNREHCFEIMTGAVIPKGCDCVVPVEDIEIINSRACIKNNRKIFRGQFIRKRGSEYRKNSLLLQPGTKVNATHIAAAASVGKNALNVFSLRIAIIGTGDELVAINKLPQVYQARRSNAQALETLFCMQGFADIKKFHLNDVFYILKRKIKAILAQHDIFVLSGGVSMGKFDFVPQILSELGFKILFHKVAQKPGKPFLFAINPGGKVVFGLPGNPVSTLLCATRYVLPFMHKTYGVERKIPLVQLGTNIKRNEGMTLFLPVILKSAGFAFPVNFTGSGDYNALTKSDGFVEIPNGTGVLKKGKGARFYSW